MDYVRKTYMVPWALLAEQFGAEYSRPRDFRADISKALREVLIVYPGSDVQITGKGLLLAPSRTAARLAYQKGGRGQASVRQCRGV